jgi:hypothetical protein
MAIQAVSAFLFLLVPSLLQKEACGTCDASFSAAGFFSWHASSPSAHFRMLLDTYM